MEDVTTCPVSGPQPLDVCVVSPAVEHAGHETGRELRRVAPAVEHAGGIEMAQQVRPRVDPADAQARRQRLGEGAKAQDRRFAIERPERRRRGALVDELPVHVVLDDDKIMSRRHRDQTPPSLQTKACAGGIVERRDGIQQADGPARGAQTPDLTLQGIEIHAVPIERQRDDVHIVVAHRAQCQAVGRRFDEHHVAWTGEHRHRQIESLRVAGGDEDVGLRRRAGLARADARGDELTQGYGPAHVAIGDGPGAELAEHPRGCFGDEIDRQQRGIRLAEAELHHAVAKDVLSRSQQAPVVSHQNAAAARRLHRISSASNARRTSTISSTTPRSTARIRSIRASRLHSELRWTRNSQAASAMERSCRR